MKYQISLIVLLIPLMFTGCAKMVPGYQQFTAQTSSSTTPTLPENHPEIPPAAGEGSKVPGVGSTIVPTAGPLVARIKNGLENSVSPTAGNFARTLTQVGPNLPKLSDPLKASGYDQAQLLIYAACSDLTTGAAPLMNTKYKVDPTKTIAVNQTALVAAGLRMLDQHTAGMASSSANAQVSSSLNSMIQKLISSTGNTSTIAFMSVCIAANTAGSLLLGM